MPSNASGADVICVEYMKKGAHNRTHANLYLDMRSGSGWVKYVKFDTTYLTSEKVTAARSVSVSDPKLKKSFDNWWGTVKDDFMTGVEEFFGFDPYAAQADWGVDFVNSDFVVLYGDIDGVSLKLKDFKEMLRGVGIKVGTAVTVLRALSVDGFKVSSIKITPEEFLKKVW